MATIIAFANPKGGAGKTTAALILASEIASTGANVTIVDAAPERWISNWGKLPNRPVNIMIESNVTEETITDVVDEAALKSSFVIIDLEGTASLMVANAIGLADLVVIPTQGASMDARGAAKTAKLIKTQSRVSRREIPHAVLFTRTSAAVTSRSLKHVRAELQSLNLTILPTPIVERAAYRDIFDYGGTLETLDPRSVSNLDKAISNARHYTKDVLDLLTAQRTESNAA